MISRAMLGLAAALLAAPLGSAAIAADRLDAGPYPRGSHYARVHHVHDGLAHRRVLYRNPAYAGRTWHRQHRWHGYARGHAYGGWATPGRAIYGRAFAAPYDGGYVRPVVRSYRAAYTYPVSGSYLGGGLIGALYNQPTCVCR